MATDASEQARAAPAAAVANAPVRRNPNKSFQATTEQGQLGRSWWVVDATDKPLGRLASEVALRLRGKHKTTYTPHVDTGDFVIVVNAKKVKLTGRKLVQKLYVRHSGEPGGFREEPYGKLLERLGGGRARPHRGARAVGAGGPS